MVKQPIISEKSVLSLNQWKKDIAEAQHHLAYVTVRDVNKVGRRHWMYCPKQKREVHALSDGELGAYKVLVWQPDTISVDEQYPLDIDETLDIAIGMNVVHPRDWKTNTAHVMTTDFVVKTRLSDGTYKRIAYTFKYWEQIYKVDGHGDVVKINRRTWQKFAIERAYWLRREVEYRVVTERDTTKARVWNINYFELAYDTRASSQELTEFGEAFIVSWQSNPRAELQEHLIRVSKRLGLTFQRSQALFQYCGLHHLLPIVTTRHIRLFRSVELAL